MGESTTVTIRLSGQAQGQLEVLAAQTRRTRSFLAGEAIAEYVARELAIVGAVRADVRAGRTLSHEDVAQESRAVIEAARATR